MQFQTVSATTPLLPFLVGVPCQDCWLHLNSKTEFVVLTSFESHTTTATVFFFFNLANKLLACHNFCFTVSRIKERKTFANLIKRYEVRIRFPPPSQPEDGRVSLSYDWCGFTWCEWRRGSKSCQVLAQKETKAFLPPAQSSSWAAVGLLPSHSDEIGFLPKWKICFRYSEGAVQLQSFTWDSSYCESHFDLWGHNGSPPGGRDPFDRTLSPKTIYIEIHNNSKVASMK